MPRNSFADNHTVPLESEMENEVSTASLLDQALQTISSLVKTGDLPEHLPAELHEHPQFRELVSSLMASNQLRGIGSQPADLESQIAHALSALHANLRNLTWQTERIAAGNFDQGADFIVRLSKAFQPGC